MKIDSRSLITFNAKKLGGNNKATVQATGRMSFSRSAEELLSLSKDVGIIFAQNRSDKNDESLFGILTKKSDPEAFSVGRSGNYYQVDIRNLLDLLGIRYKEYAVVYNVSRVEDEYKKKVFKLTLRGKIERRSRRRSKGASS